MIAKQVLLVEEKLHVNSVSDQPRSFSLQLKESLPNCVSNVDARARYRTRRSYPSLFMEQRDVSSIASAPALGSHAWYLIVSKSNLSQGSLISPCLGNPHWPGWLTSDFCASVLGTEVQLYPCALISFPLSWNLNHCQVKSPLLKCL